MVAALVMAVAAAEAAAVAEAAVVVVVVVYGGSEGPSAGTRLVSWRCDPTRRPTDIRAWLCLPWGGGQVKGVSVVHPGGACKRNFCNDDFMTKIFTYRDFGEQN